MRLLSYILVALVAVGLGLGIARAMQPPPANDIRLPLVANGSVLASSTVKILEGDYTLVSAAVSQNCEYVAIMDRGGGNFIHVGYLSGDTFVEIELPEDARASYPAFVPEGAKHAGMDLYISQGQLILLWTSRPEGATSGGFDLYKQTMALPSCQ